METDLTGQVALVTGAGRGIGRVVAEALARRGAAVALVARSTEQLRDAEQGICSSGGAARAFPADVTVIEAVDLLKIEVNALLGEPSIVVNAAGVFGPVAPIAESEPRAWIDTVNVNLIGAYLVCRAFTGDMARRGWGRIVNISSAASLAIPGPLNSAYATSKAALNHLTRHLAAELAGTGVTVNAIHPGEVKTEMWRYIRDVSTGAGERGAAGRSWAQWVEETGGDSPDKAADLVLSLMAGDAASVTGRFLWIKNGLQQPISSW